MGVFSIATNFIKRPVLTTVCTIVIVLVGGVCIPLLPINYLPDVSPVQIEVSSAYTGADVETVEDTVTTILEEQINGVAGMDYLTSQSYAGSSSISVYFPTGTDKDIAQVNVQNRVSQALPQLPTPVQQLGVTTQAASTSILLIFGVYSEAGAYDSIFISNYVDANVTDVLKRIDGVGDVTIFGAKQNAMRIWLNPQDLAARGLTALDVSQAVRSQNVVVGAGSIGQEPVSGQQQYELPVRIQGRLQDAAEFDNLVVKTLDSGAVVRLRDVGYAELGAENYGQNASVNGQQGIGIAISQLPGSNALDVGDNVKDAMDELSENFPPGMVRSLVFDTTEFIQVSIKEVFTTLLQAIALVIIIIFLFLQDWRTTVIPAVAIPVSLVGALGFAFIFGFSLNSLTLFGLILATGLVVDDAIVIVEAITAKIESGVKPRKASFAAMDEIAGAILSTSVVLMAVFIPVAFFPGTTGILYQQFALIIAFSVLVSTFNALTFTPAMSAILLRSQEETQSEDGKKGFLDKIFTPFNRFLSWVIDRYTAFVKFLIRIRYIVIGLFVLGLFATYMVFKAVPGGFVPPEDQGVLLGIVQAPDGVSLSYTGRVTEFISETFENTPEIEDYFVASGVGLEGAGPNKGVFFAKLQPWDERTESEQSVESIIEQLNQKFSANENAIITAFNLPPIPGFSSTGGIEMQLQNQSGGSLGIDDFLANAQEIIAQANQSPAVGSAFTQFTASTPQLQVDINRDRLQALNVDFESAVQTIGAFVGSQYINDFTLEGRSYRVYLQAESDYRNSPDDLESLYVQSRSGQMIPLGEIATVSRIVGPQIIYHYNGERSIKIQAEAAEDSSSGQAIAAIDEAVAEASLPGISGDWIGLAKEELAAGNLGALVFLFGIIMVFLTLSAQYESYIDPLIILLTVPLAILGALSFIALAGLDRNVYVQVALVMLIGLASKNAILIVELANQTRETGVSIVKSAQEAAQERFRPILMTAVSSLVGFFPLVIASGAGSASRRSIGTALVGGLLVSTILSFLIVPVLYVVIKSLEEKFLNKKDPDKKPPKDDADGSNGRVRDAKAETSDRADTRAPTRFQGDNLV